MLKSGPHLDIGGLVKDNMREILQLKVENSQLSH